MVAPDGKVKVSVYCACREGDVCYSMGVPPQRVSCRKFCLERGQPYKRVTVKGKGIGLGLLHLKRYGGG